MKKIYKSLFLFCFALLCLWIPNIDVRAGTSVDYDIPFSMEEKTLYFDYGDFKIRFDGPVPVGINYDITLTEVTDPAVISELEAVCPSVVMGTPYNNNTELKTTHVFKFEYKTGYPEFDNIDWLTHDLNDDIVTLWSNSRSEAYLFEVYLTVEKDASSVQPPYEHYYSRVFEIPNKMPYTPISNTCLTLIERGEPGIVSSGVSSAAFADGIAFDRGNYITDSYFVCEFFYKWVDCSLSSWLMVNPLEDDYWFSAGSIGNQVIQSFQLCNTDDWNMYKDLVKDKPFEVKVRGTAMYDDGFYSGLNISHIDLTPDYVDDITHAGMLRNTVIDSITLGMDLGENVFADAVTPVNMVWENYKMTKSFNNTKLRGSNLFKNMTIKGSSSFRPYDENASVVFEGVTFELGKNENACALDFEGFKEVTFIDCEFKSATRFNFTGLDNASFTNCSLNYSTSFTGNTCSIEIIGSTLTYHTLTAENLKTLKLSSCTLQGSSQYSGPVLKVNGTETLEFDTCTLYQLYTIEGTIENWRVLNTVTSKSDLDSFIVTNIYAKDSTLQSYTDPKKCTNLDFVNTTCGTYCFDYPTYHDDILENVTLDNCKLYDNCFGSAKITNLTVKGALTVRSYVFQRANVDNLYLREMEKTPESGFTNLDRIGNIDFCDTIHTISYRTFMGSYLDFDLSIPDSVLYIKDEAFDSTTNSVTGNVFNKKNKTLRTGKNVISISNRAFDGCEEYNVIYVESDFEGSPASAFRVSNFVLTEIHDPYHDIEEYRNSNRIPNRYKYGNSGYSIEEYYDGNSAYAYYCLDLGEPLNVLNRETGKIRKGYKVDLKLEHVGTGNYTISKRDTADSGFEADDIRNIHFAYFINDCNSYMSQEYIDNAYGANSGYTPDDVVYFYFNDIIIDDDLTVLPTGLFPATFNAGKNTEDLREGLANGTLEIVEGTEPTSTIKLPSNLDKIYYSFRKLPSSITTFLGADNVQLINTYDEGEWLWSDELQESYYVDHPDTGSFLSLKGTPENPQETWIEVTASNAFKTYNWLGLDNRIIKYLPVDVTFHPNNGEADFTIQTNEEAKIPKPENPVKVNYELVGWTLTDGGDDFWNFETDTVSTKNLHLYGKYELVNYNVKFVGEEEDVLSSEDVGAHSPIVNIATAPVKVGKTFDNWYKERQYINVWNFTRDVVKADTILYAKYNVDKYNVTFTDYPDYNQQVEHGSFATEPNPAPNKQGYEFKGWFTESTFDNLFDFENPVTSNVTLYPKFVTIAEDITITFKSATTLCGEEPNLNLPPMTIPEGTSTTLPTVSIPDHDFWCWVNATTGFEVTNATVFNSDTELLAAWKCHTVRLNAYTTEVGNVNSELHVNDKLEFTDFIKEKYEDEGYSVDDFDWYYDVNFTQPVTFGVTVTEDVDIYGKLKDTGTPPTPPATKYTITLKGGETKCGVNMSDYDTTLDFTGDPVTLPVPKNTKARHKFNGWYDSTGKVYTKIDALTEDITLVAEWNCDTATISYLIVNDSSYIALSDIQHVGDKIVMSDRTKERFKDNGYNVSAYAWYIDSKCTKLLPEDATVPADGMNVYGKLKTGYTPLPVPDPDVTVYYEVSFIVDDVIEETVDVEKGSLVSKPKNPEKATYTFEGWYTSKDYKTKWNFSKNKVNKNMYLYAKFTKDSSTKENKDEGESSSTVTTVPKNNTPQSTSKPYISPATGDTLFGALLTALVVAVLCGVAGVYILIKKKK